MFKLIVLFTIFVMVYAQAGDIEADVLNFESNNDPDGTYQFTYETSNSIYGRVSGIGGQFEEGYIRYIAPDGTPIEFQYTADEGGFKAVGEHIPQVPAHVARLLEWLESNSSDDDGSYKSVGDDGSYRE